MKVALLSNININTIIQKLSLDNEMFFPEGYNTWVQDLIQKDSNLYKFQPKSIFVVIDGNELFKNVDVNNVEVMIEQYLSYIEMSVKENPNIYYFISDIDMPLIKLHPVKTFRVEREIEYNWYKKLYDLSEKYNNLYVFDIKKMIEELGREYFYSSKVWYLSSNKFSVKGEKKIIRAINQLINATEGKRKKCLVLDLDNTMWGGVIGEDGLEGISLSDNKEGARFKDFQYRIKEIKDTGIILSIVSKNNYDDAMEVINNHPDMVLKENDFVAKKINWNNKPQNIDELAVELNIGKDSFVFIDDNPVERELVSSAIPEINVPEFPKDTCQLEKFISELYYDNFLLLELTDEDKKKTEMYEQNYKRTQEQRLYSNVDDYLKSLETEVQINKIREEDITRVAQLTQKTNQFNLTTKRYTESDIINMISSNKYIIYVGTVKDKFGDNGKCVTLIIEKKNNVIAEIDSFIMSCRVMGRFIEDAIISYVEEDLKNKGFKVIRAHYYPTKKNIPVKDLFERLGYDIVNIHDNKDYELQLNSYISNNKRKNTASIIEC